ncbi:hypothetical protein SLE2022_233580 [Rubroshorea leprosula]
MIDYTSYGDTCSILDHYVLFWEPKMKENKGDVEELDLESVEQCCSIMEESLDYNYKVYRQENAIATLEIGVVKHQTFDALMELLISKGSSFGQCKTPRCIKYEKVISC